SWTRRPAPDSTCLACTALRKRACRSVGPNSLGRRCKGRTSSALRYRSIRQDEPQPYAFGVHPHHFHLQLGGGDGQILHLATNDGARLQRDQIGMFDVDAAVREVAGLRQHIAEGFVADADSAFHAGAWVHALVGHGSLLVYLLFSRVSTSEPRRPDAS